VQSVIDGEISISNRKKQELLHEIKSKGFQVFEDRAKVSVDEESAEAEVGEPPNTLERGYDYLLSMKLWSLTAEKVKELIVLRDAKRLELDHLQKKTPEMLWSDDLDACELALNELDAERLIETNGMLAAQKKSRQRVTSKKPIVKPIAARKTKKTPIEGGAESTESDLVFDSDNDSGSDNDSDFALTKKNSVSSSKGSTLRRSVTLNSNISEMSAASSAIVKVNRIKAIENKSTPLLTIANQPVTNQKIDTAKKAPRVRKTKIPVESGNDSDFEEAQVKSKVAAITPRTKKATSTVQQSSSKKRSRSSSSSTESDADVDSDWESDLSKRVKPKSAARPRSSTAVQGPRTTIPKFVKTKSTTLVDLVETSTSESINDSDSDFEINLPKTKRRTTLNVATRRKSMTDDPSGLLSSQEPPLSVVKTTKSAKKSLDSDDETPPPSLLDRLKARRSLTPGTTPT
jgi:DNA topoisomerase II